VSSIATQRPAAVAQDSKDHKHSGRTVRPGGAVERLPSPGRELALLASEGNTWWSCARASGQSSSSRHWLAPMTKNFYRLAENSFCTPLKRYSYHFRGVVFVVLGRSRSKIDVTNLSPPAGVTSNRNQRCWLRRAASLPPCALMRHSSAATLPENCHTTRDGKDGTLLSGKGSSNRSCFQYSS